MNATDLEEVNSQTFDSARESMIQDESHSCPSSHIRIKPIGSDVFEGDSKS